MANHWRRIVIPISSSKSAAFTGSIYKVCLASGNSGVKYIDSASFGWQNKGVNQLDPGTPTMDLKFTLSTSSLHCVEADFTYVSCSVGTHVYVRTNGGGDYDGPNGSS